MLHSAIVALVLSAAVSASRLLTVTLSGANTYAGISSAVVSATLTNAGDETLKLLNHPNTVLTDWATDTFAISLVNGKRPRFAGVRVKYVPSPERSVTVLGPGESITVNHSLADAYDFSTTGEGIYSIDTSPRFHIVADDGIGHIYATTVAHEARLSGNLKRIARPVKRANYNGCSPEQESTLATAQVNAQKLVAESLAYLRAHTSATTRYTTWFGEYTDARHATVEGHYAALDGRSYAAGAYDCDCKEADTWAFTHADTPDEMTLCGLFWTSPPTGTNSQAGTLVHEATHWDVVAGTGDHEYGQEDCQQLAKDDPDLAIDNADSYEFFSENTPPLE